MEPTEYSEKHRVTYYEADFTKRMTLAMMLDVIILASEDHSDYLGVGADFVRKFGVTWIVIQYNVDINRMPTVDEEITVTTKSKSYNKYFAYREFKIKDENGDLLVHMTGLWAVMNYEARRIASIPSEIVTPFGAEKVNKVPKLMKPLKVDLDNSNHRRFSVRYTDIDSNKHVNNAHYMDWMINVLPSEFLTTHSPVHFDLRYENEVKYGTDIESHYNMEKLESGNILTKHEIMSGDKHCTVADIIWQND
ncbi:acyl-ACP thioesterase [Apilactobacillus micheneri]|uniref:Acyl-ACP thioesterase n=1 Tax=Apilactobacillus micheneri TaxID=1899430 RepID=A0ABY2YVX1_9LACO|nr:acyl-ACP thioesterase domain-containing protein [Apilactobacillus micheneri]TPR24226.1 acyl-ACP thioesterase [Apilactobacillus micheneri]TPR25245.1 acyl-ACP thioesterase [Apilactobacillus micheneri]TPR27557.1 acyl-ACP thioesterase [Apilactobacillus micheneri]TPR28822.1 acyl-ACP thioesterase [Apilactobacillus micheneri]TPR29844.1 acyl-ACP thioesterase [Apilactobacillus micheneri]